MFYQTETTHRPPKGPKNALFCPWWPWSLTFKLARVRDQTRIPCEFGANPFSGSGNISYTNKKQQTDGAKNRTLRSSLHVVITPPPTPPLHHSITAATASSVRSLVVDKERTRPDFVLPSVLWHCWPGDRKVIWPINTRAIYPWRFSFRTNKEKTKGEPANRGPQGKGR